MSANGPIAEGLLPSVGTVKAVISLCQCAGLQPLTRLSLEPAFSPHKTVRSFSDVMDSGGVVASGQAAFNDRIMATDIVERHPGERRIGEAQ